MISAMFNLTPYDWNSSGISYYTFRGQTMIQSDGDAIGDITRFTIKSNAKHFDKTKVLSITITKIGKFRVRKYRAEFIGIYLSMLLSLNTIIKVSSASTVILGAHTMQSFAPLDTEQTSYPEIRASIGSYVSLPCNVTLSSPSDAIKLILWYHGNDISGSPIYSVDARTDPLITAKHLVSDSLSSRAKFDLTLRPSVLRIDPVHADDDGQYWCRVDFRWTRTTISVVTLNVIVPPQTILITDSNGKELSDSIVLNEGDDTLLVCLSYGGKPSPVVKWLRNSEVIDDSFVIKQYSNESSISPKNRLTIVENVLRIRKVMRNHLFSVLTCQSRNDNLTLSLTNAITASITIDINLSPLSIHILPPMGGYLTVGVKAEVICRSIGSRPLAKLQWFMGAHEMTHLSESFHDGDGNFSQSILTFTPQWHHNNSQLLCRATNTRLANGSIEESIILDVRYEPIINLSFATNVKSDRISESQELVLNCNIIANPPVSVIRWLHNGQEVWNDVQKGIITSNSSLVIKSVSRSHEGVYQCVAFNNEGRGISNELKLTVDYAPLCTSESKHYQLKIGESVNISCELDARPDDVTFYWTMNDNNSFVRNNSIYFITNSWVQSFIRFTPKSATDFGVIKCWAKNSVGYQLVPCLFNVTMTPAAAPLSVSECITNSTATSIHIDCIAGDDGGSPQEFHLHVYDSRRKILLRNYVSIDPNFSVRNLTAAATFVLVIWSVNSAGRSADVTIIGKTIAKKVSIEVPLPDATNPIVLILIAICASLVILILIIFIISKIRRETDKRRIRGTTGDTTKSVSMSSSDECPDVIPSRDDNDDNSLSQTRVSLNKTKYCVMEHVTCNGGVSIANGGPMVNYQTSSMTRRYASNPMPSWKINPHVKFLTPDETNRIFNDDDYSPSQSPINGQTQEVVVATIENHPYNQRFISYSTPV